MGYLGGFGMMGGVGWIGMLLVWAVVLGLLVWSVGVPAFRQPSQDPRTEALEIVRRRFAAGEISEAEFEIARRALS